MAGQLRWPVTVSWGELRLRPLVRGDRREWDAVRARNRDWLDPWEATNPAPGGKPPTFGQFVRSLDQQARQGTALPFLITERVPGTEGFGLVGQLTVSGISWGSFLSASLGYWVDRDQAGRGVAPMAVAMATDYCFQGLGLHRMEINIRPENTKSLRVVEKLGFRDEGLRKDFLHIDGRWTDHRSFALTAPEAPEGLVRRFTGSDRPAVWQ
ncbi:MULTISPECIES: GNAT family N-acetyltransferase [Kocuria]|uniref:GNAT family acetyltransferase n=1 Tax=Kocuria rosea subsp. polaris TaxID=136273 RepID=A0A0W8IQN1_KOCRO|nr:GNAT family protein [Kocuria polaris]KUG62217.1 GNAT family acetyltransferase [Kocuria polaris]